MPVAWVMGVPWTECYIVGKLLGIKTFVNEFVAFVELGKNINGETLSVRISLDCGRSTCFLTLSHVQVF